MNLWRFQLNLEKESFSEIRAWLSSILESQGLEETLPYLTTALDEACTNIYEHAYLEARERPVEIVLRRDSDQLQLEIYDYGVRHKWKVPEKPDWDYQASHGRKRGLGRYLIQKCLDSVKHERTEDHRNLLTLTKRLGGNAVKARFGLRGRFTLLISLLVSFSVVAASLVLIYQSRDALAEETRRRAEALARNFAANIRDPLISEERPTLRYLTRQTMANKGVEYLVIFDRQGELRLHSNETIEAKYYHKPYSLVSGISGDTEGEFLVTPYQASGKRMLDVAAPVLLRKGYLSTVHLGMNEDIIAAQVTRNMRLALVIMVCFLAIGLVSSLLLATYIVRPIQRLARGAGIIGGGNLVYRINIKGRGEIGELSAQINEMTRNLKQAQEDRIERERLDKELQVAREIQSLLLPHAAPKLKHYAIASYYLPAREVGGDYYDYLRMQEDAIGVTVADVAGKGVPAALMMSMMKGYLREEAGRCRGPGELMKRANRLISGDMREGMFITGLCVSLAPNGREASVSNAGHCPLLHYQARGGTVIGHNPSGFPLGLGAGGRFDKQLAEARIKLSVGDVLLLYTDGLSEAQQVGGEQFGDERIERVLQEVGKESPEEIISRMKAEAMKFTDSDILADDITLVAIKVN